MQITFFGGERARARTSRSICLHVLFFSIGQAVERVPEKPTVPEGQVALTVYGWFK